MCWTCVAATCCASCAARPSDWSEFGGSPQPISVYLPASQAGAIAAGLGIPLSELAGDLLPDEEVADRVEATPGAFALIEPERLRLGVLALTVSGYDPYRDPARLSPLRLLGWVRAPTAADAVALLAAAGITVAPPFDPAGMVVTGELIPVRCTNHVLAALDDYGAMFDGVRDAIVAADIAVAPLESALTDLGGPTPCVETFVLQGSPRVVPALSDAGVDVVLTIGNHMLDCWGGCSGAAALFDTLARLHAAGIATAGAGRTCWPPADPPWSASRRRRGRCASHFSVTTRLRPGTRRGTRSPVRRRSAPRACART